MASRMNDRASFKTTAAGGGDCESRLECIRRRLAAAPRPGLLAMLVASVLCQGQMCGPAPAPLPSLSDQASPSEQVLGSAPPAAPSQGGGAAPMVPSDLVVDAGADMAVCLPDAVVQLQAAVRTAGGSEPDGLGYRWSVESAPGAMAFGDPGGRQTSASFQVSGRYVLRFEAWDGAGGQVAGSDTVMVTVYPEIRFSVDPGSDRGLQMPVTAVCAAATADGSPLPDGLYVWSIEPPGGGNAMSETGAFLAKRLSIPGRYAFTLTATLAGLAPFACSSADAPGSTRITRDYGNPGGPGYTGPAASFLATGPTAGVAPLTVGFDAGASTGSITQYIWQFQREGAAGTGVRPSHTYTQPGEYDVTLTVMDAEGRSDVLTKQAFVRVYAPEASVVPLIAAIADHAVSAGAPYARTPGLIQGTAPVTWSLAAGPAGMTIDPAAGAVSWSNPTSQGSPHTVTIRASNAAGSDDESWLLTVNTVAVAPVIADIPDASHTAGSAYTGPEPALTAGTAPVTWLLVSGPAGMTIDSLTGRVSWALPTTAGSPHTITIRASNAAGSDDESWQLTVNAAPPTWQNTSFATQAGQFGAEFDATPGQAGMDGVIGLSQNAASAYTQLAAIVRFNTSGTIDVRNGGAYQAAATVAYAAGTSYHFRMVVDVPAKRYSVYVRPQGAGAETTLAVNYAFRTEQSGVGLLNNFARCASVGSMQVSSPTIVAAPAAPLIITSTDSVTVPEGGTGTFQVRLSAAPASNVTVSVSRAAGDTDITVQSGASLTFTPANYATYQTVTLAAAEDADTTNGQATIRCSASGLANRDVTATEADNDPPAGVAPMTTASRTTGVAPLAVFFDAVDTTSPAWTSGVIQPPDGDYASYHYEWDFGDPASGTWSAGRQNLDGTYPSKNTATGYVAAHVYENPGTYTITLYVTDTAGQTHTYQQDVEVTAFSGTTYYVSSSEGNDANNGQSPSSPLRTLAAARTKLTSGNTRFLFKRGDSWNEGINQWAVAQPGVQFGAYGIGAKPALTGQCFWIRHPDCALVDLSLPSGSTSTAYAGVAQSGVSATVKADRLLIYRCEVSGYAMGIENMAWPDGAWYSDLCVADSDVSRNGNTARSGNNMYVSGYRLALIGNSVHSPLGRAYNPSFLGEHCIRIWWTQKCAISHNDVAHAADPARHELKLHARSEAEHYTRYVAIADNNFRASNSTISAALMPQNGNQDERFFDLLFERNSVSAGPNTQVLLKISANRAVARNNIFDGTGSSTHLRAVDIGPSGVEPTSYDVGVLNNTFYKGSGGPEFFVCTVAASCQGITVRNNLASAPAVANKAIASVSYGGTWLHFARMFVVVKQLVRSEPGGSVGRGA